MENLSRVLQKNQNKTKSKHEKIEFHLNSRLEKYLLLLNLLDSS